MISVAHGAPPPAHSLPHKMGRTMVFGGGKLMMFLLLGLVLFATPANSTLSPRPAHEISLRGGGRSAVMVARTYSGQGRILLQAAAAPDVVTCPLDFEILNEYTWIKDLCAADGNATACCTATLSGMGLGLAKYLKDTGLFHLQDTATTDACLDNFQAQLQQIGVQRDVVKECFMEANPSNYHSSMFIRSPMLCQGIETVADFRRVAGVTTIDSYCKSNLKNHNQCSLCVSAMDAAYDQLAKINATTNSECFDFVLIYAAGVVNAEGPWDAGTAHCILAVQVDASSRRSQAGTIGLYVGLGGAAAVALSIAAGIALWAWRRRRRATVHRDFVARHSKMLKLGASPGGSLVWYDFGELKAATRGFSHQCLLGEGGYGSVYKGVLRDGRTVAVKRFRSCTPDGDLDFLNEVEVISQVKHRHLAPLLGCCVASSASDGHQRLLVFDFMCHGSLADYLFLNKRNHPTLEWPERRKIAVGMARGLAYLHAEVVPQIIHRDIKTSNVLLDEHFQAHVADFGLAKLTPETGTHFTTHVAGTHGYVAPEYALYGQLTEKSDVYSFGVCLLELLSGRPALAEAGAEAPQMSLVTDWAWRLIKEGRTMDILDTDIRHSGPQAVMQRFVMVGVLCAHHLVAFRPTMTEALRMLEGDASIPEIPDRPLPLTSDIAAFDADNAYFYSAQSTPRGLGSVSQRELLR